MAKKIVNSAAAETPNDEAQVVALHAGACGILNVEYTADESEKKQFRDLLNLINSMPVTATPV